MVNFCEFLKSWSLRSNSVTRQVIFKRTKMAKLKNTNATFWVIFKHCEPYFFPLKKDNYFMRLFLSYFSNTVFCSYSGCDLGLDRLCHHRDGISIPSSKEKCQSRRRCWIPSLWSHRSRQRHFTLFRWSETGAKRTTLPLPTYQATNDRFWHQWQRKGPKRWKYFRERRWGRRRRLHCLWVSWTCSGTKPSFFCPNKF